MAYVSLYRKYRPDTFDKVIGQQHVVKTLINQVKSNTVSHAYLFTGTRGTGKTTVARILARSVNCLNSQNGSPCGECPNCKELQRLNSTDIIEIDAASNNSVDDIRELCDKTIYSPAVVKYKVYIIDEVHMLSGSAFNALLKTLEEPPEHVIFILATTDVHKLPATILSRCIRFDFKLIGTELLAENIKNICKDMGVAFEEEALRLIATAAEGSVRDSLSIADKCIAYEKNLTYDAVLEVLGASNPHQIVNIISNVINSEVGNVLTEINQLAVLGKNMASIAKDTSAMLSNILYIKNCRATAEQLGMPLPIYETLLPLCQKITNARLLFILDILNGISSELKFSNQPKILVEAAFVRAITDTDNSVGGLTQKIKELEQKIVALTAAVSKGQNTVQSIPEQGKQSVQVDKPAVTATPVQVSSTENNFVEIEQKPPVTQRQYKNFDELWRATGVLLLNRSYMLLGDGVVSAKAENEGQTVKIPVYDEMTSKLFSNRDNRQTIIDALFELSGNKYEVVTFKSIAPSEQNKETEEKLKGLFGDKIKINK